MIRVVLDTNVFLDCWVFRDPAALPLRDALDARQMIAVRSDATDLELRDVLVRPVFALDPAVRDGLLTRWHAGAVRFHAVVSAVHALRCTDPDDQKFLDLALAAQVQVLFTKDKALLATAARARRHGLDVRTPAGAAALLSAVRRG